MNLGFKKVKISVLDDAEKVVTGKTYEFNAQHGGTISANIGGLEQLTSTVDASDGVYYTVMGSVGSPTLEMSMVEMTMQEQADIFGLTYEDGILSYDKNNKAPYVCVEFFTEGLDGGEIKMALLKGKLTKEGYTLETKTADSLGDVQTIGINGTFEARKLDDKAFVVANPQDADFLEATWEALIRKTV